MNKINRQEAAMINYWASELYGKSNASEDALTRQWIQRFLEMPEEERESYQPGEVIERLPPDAVVIERLSESQDNLRDLERKEAERKKREAGINQTGSPSLPSNPKSTAYYQKPSDKLEMTDSLVRQKNRKKQKGYVPKFRTVSFSQPVHNQANIQSDYLGAVIHVVTETFKYAAPNRRMIDIANYHYQKRVLLKQINNQEMRVVPPRPEAIRQAIIYVRKYSRMTVDRFTKQNILPKLRELEVMLEESYAF